MTPTVTKQEYQAVLFSYNQLEKEWYEQLKLIAQLANALQEVGSDPSQEILSQEGRKVLERAKEALKK